MPSYATLQGCRNQLGASVTGDDAKLASFIEAASQAIDRYCGRSFGETIATYGFTVQLGRRDMRFLEHDLLSLTTLTNADATVIPNTGYTLFPRNRTPKQEIILTQDYRWTPASGDLIYEDPDGIHPRMYGFDDEGADWAGGYGRASWVREGVQIAGLWGYHTDYGLAWENTALTTSGSTSASATSLVLSAAAGTAIDVGDVLKIGSEYLLVTAPIAGTSTATTLTVRRAYNGSTAAIHATLSPIYRWLPEPLIVEATRRLVAGMYESRNNATGDRQVVAEIGAISIPSDAYVKVTRLLETFRNEMAAGAR